MADLRLGAKVRALRRREGLSQAGLAEVLEISPSYLNLIEHNRRPLTAPLLIKLAQRFAVDLATFAVDDDARLHGEALEAFADPLFDEHALTGAEVRELVAQVPGVARAVLSLYGAFREACAQNVLLAGKLAEQGVGPDGTLSLPNEEVSALLQRHGNHFPGLEDSAERVRADAGLTRGDEAWQGLARLLERRLGVRTLVWTVEAMGGLLRRYDPVERVLLLSEVLAPRSRNFQLAHMAGLLLESPALCAVVEGAPELTGEPARRLARVALANYLAAAVVMPYAPFLDAARALRYDVELLGHRFRSSFEQVCHRLTTLRRPGDMGAPFHLVRVDIAGNISKRFSASGIRFARFSGACPLWNVHAAFTTPGRVRVQVSEMPDGQRFFCIARTVERGAAGFHAQRTIHAVGLGCRVEEAGALVYADGLDLSRKGPAVPVGVTCRLCTRMDCEQRAMPPLRSTLAVDEDVRSASFYAPRGGQRSGSEP